KRAINSEPSSAAVLNISTGSAERMPTCVPFRPRSAWIIAMTGGVARIVIRSATPTSQRRPAAVHCCRIMGLALSRRALEALKRLDDLAAALFGFLALLALALDHLLGRARDELGIAKLGVDARDV